MGVRYEGMKLVWLKQAGGKTTTIAWVSPDEGTLGSFAGGSKIAIPVKVRVINGPKPTFSLVDGQLPPGLTFDTATGAISGTPENATGDFNFTLRATSGEATVERAFQIAVATNAAPVWVTPTGSLGSPFDSTDYDYTLEATDPEGQPVTYSLVTGSLPGGLKLNPATGEIKGRLRYVNANTTFYFTVKASDGIASTNESFNITVKANEAPFWITANPSGSEPLVRFIENVEHTFQFVAKDPEDGELTYTIQSGTLPEGFTLNSATGVLTGTLGEIASNRTISLTLLASDGVKGAERTFTIGLVKNVPPVWTAPVAPFEEVSGYVATIPFFVADPNGRPVTISVKDGETLPAGFSIIDFNVIGMVPTVAENTDYAFTLVASDGVLSAEHTITLRARPNTAPVWQTAADLGEVVELRPLTRQLSAIDPEGKPLTYTATSDLPLGLSLSAGGLLSGTPIDLDEDTTFEFSVEVSDGVHQVERDFSLLVRANVAPVWQTAAGSLGDVYGHERAEFVLLATDANNDPVSYSLTSGSLPTGLALVGNRIAGMAAAYTGDDTIHTFTVSASDGQGNATPRTFSVVLKANQPLVWETAAGRQGEAFEKAPITFTVKATDPEGKPVVYGLPRGGKLPDGFSLNSTTGAISGIVPTLSQDAEIGFTILAYVNGQDESASISRTFNILGKFNTAPAFTSPSTMDIVESRSVSALRVLAINPGNGPMVYTVVSGALPAGVTLQSNGFFSGFAPVAAQDTDYTFTVRAHNGIKFTEQAFTISVKHNYAPVWQTAAGSLGTIYGGVGKAFTPNATDANAQPIMYSLVSGSLPAGMSLAPATGVISGAPNIAAGDVTSTFVLGASDGVLRTDREFSITVSANTAPTWTTPAGSLGEVVRNKNFSIALLAADAEGSKLTYSISAGQLPQGILLNPNTGALVGRAPDVTADETYTFTVRVSDGVLTADREFSISVKMDAAPVWNTPAGSLGSVLSGYAGSFVVTATDPEGLPISYSMISGSLPQGWGFDTQTNAIRSPESGSAIQSVDETFTFTIRASDGQVFSDRQFSVTVLKNLKPSWNAVYNTNLGSKTERSDIDFTVQATDPEAQGVTYVVTDGALPGGISLNPTTGKVSGKLQFVTEDTDFAFTIKAYDGKLHSDALNYTLRVLFDSPPIWTTAAGSLGTALEDTDFTATVAANSNGGEVIYGLKFGSNLPGTLTINDETGVISGKLPLVELPNVTYTFTLLATNASEKTSERTFSIIVQDNFAPVWETAGGILISDLAGTPFSFTLVATDANNTPLTYSVVEGDLPAGVTFDPATRVLSGILPEVETDTTYAVTIGASDGNIRTDREFRLRSLKDTAPVWTTAADLGTAVERAAFSITLAATDNQGKPVTYALKAGSTLPGTLTLTGSPVGGQNPIPAGRLSGSLPANDVVGGEDTYSFIIVASDGTLTTEREFTLKVRHNAAPVWGTAAGSLGVVVEGQNFSQTLVATDPENKPVTYAVAEGSTLPGGIFLNSTTGVLSGTAGSVTANTAYSFTIEAKDDLRTTPRTFSMTINNAEAPVDNQSGAVVLLMQMNGNYNDNTGKRVYPTNAGGAPAVWLTNSLVNDWNNQAIDPSYIFGTIGTNAASQSGQGALDFTNGGANNGKNAGIIYAAGNANDGYLGQVSTKNFTIEGWFRMNPRGTEEQTLFSQGGYASYYGSATPPRMSLAVQYRPGVGMTVMTSATTPETALTIPGDFADGNWHHVAVTRQGNVFRHFVDGVPSSGTLTSTPSVDGPINAVCHLGNVPNLNAGLNGQVDGFRVTVGEALYTAAFTPSPTLAYASSVGPQITSDNAKTDFGDSLRFTTLGQGVSVGHSEDFVVAVADEFTIEAWVRPDDLTSTGAIFSKSMASAGFLTSYALLKQENRYRLNYAFTTTRGVNGTAGVVKANQWQHVAMVISRQPSNAHTIKVYIDGVLDITDTIQNAGIRSLPFAPLFIGTDESGTSFKGQIDEVRITRAARYTANFTPSAIQTNANPRIETKRVAGEYEMQPASHNLIAVDAGETGSLSYSQTGLAEGLILSPTTGQITGTTPDAMFTPNTFTLTVTDGRGNKAIRPVVYTPKQVTTPSAARFNWRFNDRTLGVSSPVSLFNPSVAATSLGTTVVSGTVKYAAAPGKTGEFALNIQGGHVAWNSTASALAFMAEPAASSTSEFTVEGWFYMTAATTGGASTLFSIGGNGLRFFVDGSGLGMTYAGNIMAPRMTMTINTWHHVSVVRQGTTTKVYIDGVVWQTFTSALLAPSEINFGTVSGSDAGNFRFGTPTYLRDWTFYNVAKYLEPFTPRWKAHHDPMWLSTADVIPTNIAGQTINTQLVAQAVEGRTLTYTSSNLPSGVTLSPTGLVGGVYPAEPTTFTVVATDSTGIATPPKTFNLPVTLPFLVDPHALYVRNYFPMTGADGAAPVDTRRSATPTYYSNGAPQVAIRSQQSKWGVGSASFGGAHATPAVRQTTASTSHMYHTPTNLGGGDFTAEMWVYPTTTNSSTNYNMFWSYYPSTSGIYMLMTSDNRYLAFTTNNGSIATIGATPMALNTWHHVALTRENGIFRIYLNGVKQGNDVNYSINLGSTDVFGLGGFSAAPEYHAFKGFMSDYRLTVKKARYTGANFPVPTQAMDSKDSEGKNPPMVGWDFNKPAGAMTAANATLDGGLGTGYVTDGGTFEAFNGQKNVLRMNATKIQFTPVAGELAFMAGDFTWETWVNPATQPGNWSPITIGANEMFRVLDFTTGTGNNGKLSIFYNGTTATFPQRMNSNEWTHLAVVKTGNSITCYTNGVAGTPVNVTSPAATAFNTLIAVNGYTSGLSWSANAKFSNFVFYDYARYTGAFTPKAM